MYMYSYIENPAKSQRLHGVLSLHSEHNKFLKHIYNRCTIYPTKYLELPGVSHVDMHWEWVLLPWPVTSIYLQYAALGKNYMYIAKNHSKK